MSLWEFFAACDGYDTFHGSSSEEGGVQAPTVEEFLRFKAAG
jgi:hypothetical protein